MPTVLAKRNHAPHRGSKLGGLPGCLVAACFALGGCDDGGDPLDSELAADSDADADSDAEGEEETAPAGESGEPADDDVDADHDPSVDADAAEVFGGDPPEDPIAIETTLGTRPLLVILLQSSATAPLAHDAPWYRDRVFGPTFPNVADYFAAISNNRFTFGEATVINVVDRMDAPFLAMAGATGVTGTLATRLRSLMLAELAGFAFKDYDANDDGLVTSDELAVLTIDNYSEGSGQAGGTPCIVHSGGLQVCTAVSLAGHRSRLMTFAHELSHLLGTIDLYGTNCNSLNETVMSCTGDSGSEASDAYHIDPWHRDRLGWTESETFGGASGSLKLSPVSSITGPFGSPGQERLVFTRSATNEQLILEHRRHDGLYDKDAAQEGIVAWYVKTGGGTSGPVELPSLVGGGNDGGVFTLAPTECFGDPSLAASRGRTAPVYQSGSSYRFRWLDGTDVGKRFTIGSLDADGTITVSWDTNTVAPDCPQAAHRPDFVVESIGVGCPDPGFPPRVLVTVGNHGNGSGAAWVDLFVGLPAAPSIGTLSSVYAMSPTIAPGGTALVNLPVDASNQNQSKWVDILLDTTQEVIESVETNNHGEAFVTFPDCSLP